MTGWTEFEIEIWAAVVIVAALIAGRGIVWLRERIAEHLATCERCYQRRHPQAAGPGSVPDPPALPLPLVDATGRELVASTSPNCRVDATTPMTVGVSAPRPWAAPPQAAHTVGAGPQWRRPGPAPTPRNSRG